MIFGTIKIMTLMTFRSVGCHSPQLEQIHRHSRWRAPLLQVKIICQSWVRKVHIYIRSVMVLLLLHGTIHLL